MSNLPPSNGLPSAGIETGFRLLFALLPWSVDCDFGNWNLDLPSEPLMLLLGLALAWQLASKPAGYFGKGWRRHRNLLPGIISLLWIGWMAVSTCFSSMPTVSAKYWLVEAGHWWVFAVAMFTWPALWWRVLPVFAFSMAGVAIYTVIHHSYYDFRVDQALLAPKPFFPDHTMYAAVLAMLVFFVPTPAIPDAGLAGKWLQSPKIRKAIAGMMLLALVLSTCRAAWLSTGVAGILLAGYSLRKKTQYLMLGVLILGILSYQFAGKIKSWSSSNDVSFQERRNRWDCAASMLATRPWTGYGPGTFQFQYVPFQRPENMTRISIREPLFDHGPDTYGRGGSAHSEYWQAASETGWPGFLIWIALVFSVLWTWFRQAAQAASKEERLWALLTALGLLTYFIHGLANNFLHDDRVAALVWGAIGVSGYQSTFTSSINSQHLPSR